MRTTQKSLLQVLGGVAAAAKTPATDTAMLEDWISSVGVIEGSFTDWKAAAYKTLPDSKDERVVQLAKLALVVSYLREATRNSQEVSAAELTQCWDIARDTIRLHSKHEPLRGFSASRSAQGFVAVSLCDLYADGILDEHFRLHIWTPEINRGNTDSNLHSSQTHIHSWTLAGEGRSHTYQASPVMDPTQATHARYTLAWSGSSAQSHDTTSAELQDYFIVENTGQLFRAQEVASKTHTRNAAYSLPEGTFYTSQVDPDTVHATFCFSEVTSGSAEDTTVLAPLNGNCSSSSGIPTTPTPQELVEAVEAIRSWETLIEEGREHARKAEWEDALRAFNGALSLCESDKSFPNAAFYRHLVLGEIGSVNRRFGRYDSAKSFLKEAINGLKPCIQRVEFSGELGISYRHLGMLKDASSAFNEQYENAKQLGADRELCRAVGNLGMVNYQLSQKDGDQQLLHMAMAQLKERVDLADDLIRKTPVQRDNSSSMHWLQTFETWKTIGLCRLSICHYTSGNVDEAITTSKEALEMTENSKDVTVKAMTRFFYGRALIKGGRQKEALSLFNIPGTCSPAIAFAKEPSEEHRGYLQEMVDIGADLNIVDEQGYTALDHAVFNGDVMTENIILEGLRKSTEENIQKQQTEARLRKGYRELFQEKLRPVLLNGGQNVLSKLRKAYAEALDADETKRDGFDGLKFMWYSDFLDFKRLPRSDDGLVKEFGSRSSDKSGRAAEKVVFISYRWINKTPGAKSPDDDNHTQYLRMIDAIEEYLRFNPSTHKEKLGIWMDHACVNQDDPNAGVSALPMIIAQCDAMISLVDDDYYDRGWCAVEVMMAETLRSSYNIHQWYEHVVRSGGTRTKGVLREAPDRPIGMMKDKRLTFETDRPKVLFLERQSKLLRRTSNLDKTHS